MQVYILDNLLIKTDIVQYNTTEYDTQFIYYYQKNQNFETCLKIIIKITPKICILMKI